MECLNKKVPNFPEDLNSIRDFETFSGEQV